MQGHSKNGAGDEGDCGCTIFAKVLAGFRDGEAGAADESDGEVAQGSDGAGAGTDAAAVLEESDIADVVQPVFDGPVVSDELEQALRRGPVGRQAGDEIDDLDALPAPDPASTLDAGDLGEAGPGEIGNDLLADGDAAGFDAAMALVDRLGKAQIRWRPVTGGKRRRRRF